LGILYKNIGDDTLSHENIEKYLDNVDNSDKVKEVLKKGVAVMH